MNREYFSKGAIFRHIAFFSLAFIAIFTIVKPDSAYALCGGNYTCCTVNTRTCIRPDGSTCLTPSATCTCTYTCNNQQTFECGPFSGVNSCVINPLQSVCVPTPGYTPSGGCYTYNAPSCGDGTCNGSETCSSCAADCSSTCPAPGACSAPSNVAGWCQADGCGCGQRSIVRVGTGGVVCGYSCVADAGCACSPGNTAPIGSNDGQVVVPGTCSIAGWACDADNYATPLGVAAYEGSTYLNFGVANYSRPDLVTAGVCGGNPNHGFILNLPASVQDGAVHYITMQTQGVLPGGAGEPLGTNLNGNPRPVVCAPTACTITTNPPGIVNVSVGGVVNFTATLAASNPPVDEMRFIVSDPTRATATSPIGPVNHPSYVSQVQGLALGSTTITVQGYRAGVLCGSVAGGVQVNVVPPAGWYQILNGDVFAANVANLTSPIPDSCVGPGCSPYLIAGTFPGIAFYGGVSFDASANPSNTGSVSTNNWVGNTSYGGKMYTYADFASLVPSTITPNPISGGVTANTIQNSGVIDSMGYEWHQANSAITLTQPINIPANERIIVLAQGDVTINGNITMVQPRSSHFMIISSGNITIAPAVTDIDGVLFAQGTLNTGTTGAGNDTQLNIRGSVYAGSVNMQRNLGVGNATAPGEVFEFLPELFVTYHPFLSPKKVIWKEVSP